MAGEGFSINSLNNDGGLTGADFEFEPLPPQAVEQIRQQAEVVRATLAESSGVPAAFDGAAVKRLSEEVNSARATFDEEKTQLIANLYGMFLGEALLRANPHSGGQWGRLKSGDIAICWTKPKGDMAKMFTMPISRVFKQIEHGEQYSMLSLFLAMPQALAGQPAAQPAKRSVATPAKSAKAASQEGWFTKFRRILNSL